MLFGDMRHAYFSNKLNVVIAHAHSNLPLLLDEADPVVNYIY